MSMITSEIIFYRMKKRSFYFYWKFISFNTFSLLDSKGMRNPFLSLNFLNVIYLGLFLTFENNELFLF